MGYVGAYSLGQRCLTEYLATFTAIGLGEAILANELLPSTKGHACGFGFVAFGFGMCFTFAILIFGYSSAHLNPAMCLSLLVRGKLSFTDFLALSASEMAGGFSAALFVYSIYLPHFRTVPEAEPNSNDDNLLRTRDHIDPSALRFASYSTKPQYTAKHVTTNGGRRTLKQRIANAKYYLLNQSFDDDPDSVMEYLIGGTYALHGAEVPFPTGAETLGRNTPVGPRDAESAPAVPFIPGKAELKRRHSLQVADLQRLLKKMERELGEGGVVHFRDAPSTEALNTTDGSNTIEGSVVLEGSHTREASNTMQKSNTVEGFIARPTQEITARVGELDAPQKAASLNGAIPPFNRRTFANALHFPSPGPQVKFSRDEALGRAAIAADQATKLSVFCTRPAIFLPLHNFWVEMMGTAWLIFGASMIDARFEMIPTDVLFHGAAIWTQPFLVGMMIFAMIMGLGGPTGFAANPARDMAPRLAHFLLPIPGKGTSELWYGVIINVAALFGGAVGGWLFMAADSIPN
ncbi:hypothetical protein HDU98_001008 [Podochytrium sp. JEL0797]|nr:hypothetical protein HDU98_001008 [Podochytrium sp. JEL0797]